MMINKPMELPEEDKESFATNWYDNANEIFELIVSDYIWQNYGYDHKETVNIEKIPQTPNFGILADKDREVVFGGFNYNPNKGIWTLYANEE